MKQHGCKPSLGHSAVAIAFDISLAVPDGGKHALDGIRASHGLSWQARNLEPMKRQDILEGFQQRVGSGFIMKPTLVPGNGNLVLA